METPEACLATDDLVARLSSHSRYLRGERGFKFSLGGSESLAGANLRDANLRDADLTDADLTGADLSKANLRKAYLDSANLSRANLRDAYLIDASLTGASLHKANLVGANLRKASLMGAKLRDAELSDAKLTSADLRDAKLTDADLSRANLIGANLSGANLLGANLAGASLYAADLRGAIFSSSKSAEMAEAKELLALHERKQWVIDMHRWHGGCGTTHCVAGAIEPGDELPAKAAAQKCPTLALIFYKSHLSPDKVIKIVEAVASGELSLWNGSVNVEAYL